jgi:hypothetical protein
MVLGHNAMRRREYEDLLARHHRWRRGYNTVPWWVVPVMLIVAVIIAFIYV